MTTPEPRLDGMSVDELVEFAQSRNRYAGRAVFELGLRAPGDDAAAAGLGALSRVQKLRDDRVFHLVSQAWAAIIGLLAAETPFARQAAYLAFADLEQADRGHLLAYLKVERIEDAHPNFG